LNDNAGRKNHENWNRTPGEGIFEEETMKIAITGGTGFVGGHLARSLTSKGHNVVLIARGLDSRNADLHSLKRAEFKSVGTTNEDALFSAFQDCDAVAHCAGINREINAHDYDLVHVKGTQNVVNAAKRAGVKKIAIVGFYSARPNCGSGYHESKFAAEEIVSNSGLDYTVFKPGMIYGKGDHMLDHLSHVFHTLPIFGLVGFTPKWAAPLAIEDMIKIMEAALVEGKLSRQTVPILGPDRITLETAVRRVAKVVGKTPLMFPMPIAFHYGFALVLESMMKIPLVSVAQVRILSEGFDEIGPSLQLLPKDIQPSIMFSEDQIRKGLPEPGSFTMQDLRCWGGAA
jgi:nucleoside-diphosphate-sugar epimerase